MSINPDNHQRAVNREHEYFNNLAARHHIGVAQSTCATADESCSGRYRDDSFFGGRVYNSSFSSASASASSGPVDYRTFQAMNTDRRNGNAAFVFGIALIGLAGLLAYVTKDYSEKCENLEEAKNFKKWLKGQDFCTPTKKEIVNSEINFAEKELSKSRRFVAVTVTLLATAAVGFTAGMLGVSWLVTASIITGVFTLAIGAFLGVRHCIDKKNALPAHVIENLEHLVAENNTRYSHTG